MRRAEHVHATTIQETNMTTRPTPFLRNVLLLDAVATGATGLLMTFFAGTLTGLLQIPNTLLFYAGLILLPYAVLVGWLARRETLPRWSVWAVIVTNALWAVDSVLLAMSGWVEPNALGYAFILMQALVVVGFAELQYVGLRRSTLTTA
jgi:hypothetical protein